jgi:site-specific DNA recombinase
MNTAIYLRVSTEEQAINGYGLGAQREQCKAMATVKGWEVNKEYLDDTTGTKGEEHRPGLASLLDDVCNGDTNAVIVSSLDRLGRSTRLVLDLVERIVNCNAEIISCKETLDTSTPQGRFVLRMFASLAELERDTIVERTTAGRNTRGKIDGEKGGRVPMGYQRIFEDAKAVGVELDPGKVSLVRDIFSQRSQGETLSKIADTLNDRGETTPRGGTWHASSVREILLNDDKYRGGYRGDSQERWPVLLYDDHA